MIVLAPMTKEVLGAQLLEWLRRHQEDMVGFVSDLVRIESPSNDPTAQQPVFRRLVSALQDLGMKSHLQTGSLSGGILHASRPSSPASGYQLLLGHCDTVWPHGTLKKMPLRRSANQLAGPGVFDMKSGLGHMIFALRALQSLEVELPAPVRILINSDEETGSLDSRETIREVAESATRVFVLEPAAGQTGKLKTARKGIAQFLVRIQGKASHAGLAPEEGVSAILELSHLIQTLWSLNDLEHGLSVNVGVVEGGLRANVVAPEATARVDIRVVEGRQLEEIEQTIRSLRPKLEGVRLNIEDWHSQLPLERTPRHRPLWRMAKESAQQLGFELEETLVGGGSDGNLTSQYAPTLDGLGAVGGGAHAQHEFILLDKMLERTALLGLLLSGRPSK